MVDSSVNYSQTGTRTHQATATIVYGLTSKRKRWPKWGKVRSSRNKPKFHIIAVLIHSLVLIVICNPLRRRGGSDQQNFVSSFLFAKKKPGNFEASCLVKFEWKSWDDSDGNWSIDFKIIINQKLRKLIITTPKHMTRRLSPCGNEINRPPPR